MVIETWNETYEEQVVNYVLEYGGRLIVVENVPARVCLATGERLFSPETVEQLQATVWGQRSPKKVVETPVFEFAF